ncbi:pre-rRNA-processing protein esf1 [Quillaja saponaria]|uniref:Pre-rRNA-processing protein esf1 n=1 Tax=Quillaja saponaria TaxID=32244 RepID=A0AAD7KR54_QUISA|nr:pre-rRNA-processing protein esf1 [Quillaja saponaria]
MGVKNANHKKQNKKKKKNTNSDPSPPEPDNHGGRTVITDPRFSSVHSDPRFREVPKHKTKVEIDSRFNQIFTDKRFDSSSAPVDKRGKPKKRDGQQNSLRHYYKLEEEEAKEEDVEKEVEESSEEDDEDEEVSQELEKPIGLESSAESESSGSEGAETDEVESTTDTDEDEDEVYGEDMQELLEESIPQIERETHRLAIVNLDWRYVTAADLYVALSSFVPENGVIKSVAVYPSEFGLQRLKEEEVHGPVGLFDDENAKSDEDDNDEEILNEKLRAYEISRLRYYFAVVECLYQILMEFNNPPRDIATEAPANYEGLDFHTQALQLSKVPLSWDEDEPHRAKTLKRKFNADQLEELELREFLASDESESDDDVVNDKDTEDQSDKMIKKREKYRSLIQSGDGSDGDGEEDGKDMEVTFNTGLEYISKHILEKKDKKSETVWEGYLRKRREKKKARKNKSKYSSDDDSSDTDREATEQLDDFFLEEPSVKKRKVDPGKSDEEQKQQDLDKEDKASREELELLLADDQGVDTGPRGYNMKSKKAKGKKGKETLDEAKIPYVDYDDPRFAALFTSPQFALDPTDPQFKRSAVYARQLAQKQHKADWEPVERENAEKPGIANYDEQVKSDALPSDTNKHELSVID